MTMPHRRVIPMPMYGQIFGLIPFDRLSSVPLIAHTHYAQYGHSAAHPFDDEPWIFKRAFAQGPFRA